MEVEPLSSKNESCLDRSACEDPFTALRAELEPQLTALMAHPIYQRVRGPSQLRTFMSAHVFAVWDFMTLLKALQGRLTTVSLPWTAPRHPHAARFINEVVLAEESDEVPPGRYLSHFELYLEAMRELQCEQAAIRSVTEAVRAGAGVGDALRQAHVPACVQQFVLRTMQLAESASEVELAAEFLFGREDPIPQMFSALLDSLGEAVRAPTFKLYLERHVLLDGDQHGPAAARLLTTLCGQDQHAWKSAASAARAAIAARIALWDGVLALL